LIRKHSGESGDFGGPPRCPTAEPLGGSDDSVSSARHCSVPVTRAKNPRRSGRARFDRGGKIRGEFNLKRWCGSKKAASATDTP
jgi:hypothetical protein